MCIDSIMGHIFLILQRRFCESKNILGIVTEFFKAIKKFIATQKHDHYKACIVIQTPYYTALYEIPDSVVSSQALFAILHLFLLQMSQFFSHVFTHSLSLCLCVLPINRAIICISRTVKEKIEKPACHKQVNENVGLEQQVVFPF